MSDTGPTIENLVEKALAAQVISADDAADLLECDGLEEAVSIFYTLTADTDHDTRSLLKEWNIIEPTE